MSGCEKLASLSELEHLAWCKHLTVDNNQFTNKTVFSAKPKAAREVEDGEKWTLEA